MKISESDFRRLHWKSRKLDEVCRILWPDGERPSLPSSVADEVIVDSIENLIGEYRPGPLRTVDQFIDGEKVSR